MIDLLLLVVIGGSTLLGLLRGFVGTLVSLAAWLLSGWASFRFGEHAAFWLSDDGIPSSSELLGGYASVFVAVVVAITLAGMLVKTLVKSVGLSGLDRMLGMALGLLRGIRDTRVPMIAAAVSYWLIGIPCSYVLAFKLGWGGQGLWLGLTLGLVCAAASMMARFWARAPRVA